MARQFLGRRQMCCGSVEPAIDFHYPKTKSEAYSVEETCHTALGTSASAAGKDLPRGHSGFHFIVDGTEALAARLVLARKAVKCIDSQYYLMKDDVVGRIFLHTLLQAADRGVRVRFLIDDMFTKGFDSGMAALCSHPNFEVRVFNPFQRNDITDKSVDANLVDFERVNRRMHNKSFTVDSHLTILGGRNIADEYFGRNAKARFHDDDVLCIGPVVQDVSNSFDQYWNHRTALPAPAFCRPLADPAQELKSMREYLADSVRDQASTKYSEATRTKAKDYIHKLFEEEGSSNSNMFRSALYQFVADSPNKGVPSQANLATNILTPLTKSIQQAQHKLLVVSPYFVPTRSEIQEYAALVKKGIEVTILTNSLSANNMVLVHGGYAPVRVPLLQAGVHLYEARADASVEGSEHINSKQAVTTLHTKEFVVDSKELFIGSFNFDPRSIHLNTECGVIIRDAEMAQELVQGYEERLKTHAFQVYLKHNHLLRWKTLVDGEPKVFRTEPQATLVQRLVGGVFARLVPKSQL